MKKLLKKMLAPIVTELVQAELEQEKAKRFNAVLAKGADYYVDQIMVFAASVNVTGV